MRPVSIVRLHEEIKKMQIQQIKKNLSEKSVEDNKNIF